MLTPPSELPKLPEKVPGYLQIHIYTAVQIVVTGVIFYVTLTVAGPAFPVIIIALVPIRLLLMNKLFNREVLRYVDAWACQDGTPEDDEDRRRGIESSGRDHDADHVDEDQLDLRRRTTVPPDIEGDREKGPR